MASVKVESRSGLGNVLVATGPFQPGEAVVYERSLLHVPMLKPSNPLYKPLQAYFEEHHIPPSVVLKVMAFVMSSSSTQASVLRCFCPDITAYADAAVVQQARTFANCLLQHPPIPEFAEWAESQQRSSQQSTDTQQQPQDPTTDSSTPLTQQQQQQNPQAYDTLVKVWLIWVMNGHKFKLGSALFDYGSKLTHTCACPNTMYRTATGDIAAVVETVDGSSSGSAGSSSSLRQPPPAGAGAGADADAHAAGVHVALSPIATGDLLTTNYLGMGHKRVMSTPARQKHLQDKFLFKCTCSRCTQDVDTARGIPCPSCSGPYRSEDKLLNQQEALTEWQLGQSITSTPISSSSGTSSTADAGAGGAAAASSDTSDASSAGCGYVYCDMAAALSGASTPWKCDKCGAAVANHTAELWGRFYTKSHATIESEMEGWVNRLDDSMDTAPLVRDPSVLHQRVLGVVRLLGPRHWASWRLLLLGVELHCGAMEEAMMKVQMRHKAQQRAKQAAGAAAAAASQSATPAAADPAATATDAAKDDSEGARATGGVGAPGAAAAGASEVVYDPDAAACITGLAVWVVRYCKQLWVSMAAKLSHIEVGQVLGHHFSEAAQVLLQVASVPGILPQATATGLVDAALQLQLLVLPGLRSIMGASFNPLTELLGTEGLAAAGGGADKSGFVVDAAAVAAAVRRQTQQRAAEASQMMSLVRELKQLEAKERV